MFKLLLLWGIGVRRDYAVRESGLAVQELTPKVDKCIVAPGSVVVVRGLNLFGKTRVEPMGVTAALLLTICGC